MAAQSGTIFAPGVARALREYQVLGIRTTIPFFTWLMTQVAYRRGEFLYQDFLYDDRALTYPDEPKRYAGNAADLVEVRLKPLADRLAVRLTYNSMLDPDAVAATVVLGDSPTARRSRWSTPTAASRTCTCRAT